MDGKAYTFEVFGLDQAVLTMIDRETGTIWTHLDGRAIRGPLADERMTLLSVPMMTWGDWKGLHAESFVLSPNTPFSDRYRPVRIGLFNHNEARYGDGRLDSNTLVVGVEAGGDFRGYPVLDLAVVGGIINEELGGEPILVVYDATSTTGLAYSRRMGREILEFVKADGDSFRLTDATTGTTWDVQGRAIAGPLEGEDLEFVPSFVSEWYGWSAYHPETTLFRAQP